MKDLDILHKKIKRVYNKIFFLTDRKYIITYDIDTTTDESLSDFTYNFCHLRL